MGDRDDAYSRCLDRIFEDFLARRPLRLGRHDRELRTPGLVLDIARERGLLPPPARVLKITGSKGKGTVARLAAARLAAAARLEADGGPVGLFVSPNELDQADRIRIDGTPIPRAELIRLYETFAPDLARAKAALTGGRYLSPFGIFLLIALAWFRENGVAWQVLEGGRGAAHDEVGRLPAETAVVTSIFLEHQDQIGPSLRDIAADKLAIAEGAAATILGPEVPGVLARTGLPLPPGAVVARRRDHEAAALPAWCGLDLDIADAACDALLARNGRPVVPVRVPIVTASYGRAALDGVPLVYDATGAFAAFDQAHFAALRRRHGRPVVVLSLSDQKVAAPFLDHFGALGVPVLPIALDGLDQHSYRRMLADADHPPAGTVGFTDAPGLAALLRAAVAPHRPDLIYALGIQPFVRLLKQALSAEGGRV